MTEILIYYIVSLLFLVGSIWGIGCLFKKQEMKMRWGMFFLGILAAILYFAVVMVLFKLTFSGDEYYNTPLFRGTVGFVFIALLCLLRALILKGFFFGKYKEEQGLSLSFGFGIAPGLLLSFYLLIMAVVLAVNGIFNGPCVLEEGGYLSFADNTIITVFRPAAGHLSFAVLFVSFAVLILASGWLHKNISMTKRKMSVSIIWTIFLVVLEVLAVLPVPFFAMFGLSHWHVAVIGAIAAIAAVLLVRFMPRVKEEGEYTKQFD